MALIIFSKGEEAILIVTLGPGAFGAIRDFLFRNDIRKPVRIDLHSSGCCDPSLFLRVDSASEKDLTCELNGLTFVMDAETHALAGEVNIAWLDENGRQGFVLTSSRPLSEWEGFAPIGIQV